MYTLETHERCEDGTHLSDLNHWMIAFDLRFIPSIALTALTLLLLNEMRKVNARFLKLRVGNMNLCSHQSNASASASAPFAPVDVVVEEAGASRSSPTRPTTSAATSQQATGADVCGGQCPSPKFSCGQLQSPAHLSLLPIANENQNETANSSQNKSNGYVAARTSLAPTSSTQRPSIFGINIGSFGSREAERMRGGIGRNVRFAGGAKGGSPRSNSLEESRRLRESNRTTRMLLWVVAMFLVVEFPQGVLHVVNSLSRTFEQCGYNNLGDLLDLETLVMNTVKVCAMCQASLRLRFCKIAIMILFIK